MVHLHSLRLANGDNISSVRIDVNSLPQTHKCEVVEGQRYVYGQVAVHGVEPHELHLSRTLIEANNVKDTVSSVDGTQPLGLCRLLGFDGGIKVQV